MWQYVIEEARYIRQALGAWPAYVLMLAFGALGGMNGLPWPVLLPLAAGMALLWAVDARHFVLPDILTLPGIALGLWLAPLMLGLSARMVWMGALVGGAVFAVLAGIFYLVRKKEGMGLGDVKLLALIGAWTGLTGLLPALLVASFSALLFLPLRRLLRGASMQEPIPFGPFLIAGFWVGLLYQHYFWYWLLGGRG